ncbi:MAG: GNAT family N-acetyltransferase [Armatimonadota bacterium]
MAKVTLHEVNKENWSKILDLSLKLDQGGIAVPQMFAVGDSDQEPTITAMVICDGDETIGFLMYGLDPDDGKYWIYRLLIDEDHQGKGYGRAAMEQVINHIKETTDVDEIKLGYRPDNIPAAHLSGSLGFVPTGEMFQGEIIASLKIER